MNRYWFRPKRYGYGATPSTWEGWAAAAGVVVLTILATLWIPALFPTPGAGYAATLVAVLAIIAAFLWLVWKKTDAPWRWRWGDED